MVTKNKNVKFKNEVFFKGIQIQQTQKYYRKIFQEAKNSIRENFLMLSVWIKLRDCNAGEIQKG